MRYFFLPLILVALFLSAPLPASAVDPSKLKVQIVDDTGWANSPFVALQGKPFTGTTAITVTDPSGNLAVVNLDTSGSTPAAPSASNVITPKRVSDLTADGTLVSTYTGQTRTIRTFDITSIGSGGVYFFYNYNGTAPYSWNSVGNPSFATANYRFDFAELSFNASNDSVADLTTIDQVAIPMELELFNDNGGTLELVESRRWYASLDTFINAVSQLDGGVNSFGPALLKRNTSTGTPDTGWTLNGDGWAKFLRLLGPGQLASANPTGDPSPYPSFKPYLDSLIGYTFTVAGNANGTNFHYTGNVISDGAGGYKINMTSLPGSGATDPVVVLLPGGSVQTENYNSFLYGATLSDKVYTVNGQPQTNTNTVYGAIVRDALAAINYGFMKGRAGNNSEAWYGTVPMIYPFGLARVTNDGFYNPWAAYVYNYSDAYGFAFSDTKTPSPGLKMNGGQVLRITLLPDARLDTPRVVAVPSAGTGDTSGAIDLTWPAVAGATSYTIAVQSPDGIAPHNQPAVASPGKNTYQLTGLRKGTPYYLTVVANGTANSNPVSSPAQQFKSIIPGSTVPVVPAANSTTTQMLLSWQAPGYFQAQYPEARFMFNGVALKYYPGTSSWRVPPAGTGLAMVDLEGSGNGTFKTNDIPVQMMSSDQPDATVLFVGNMSIGVQGDNTSYTIQNPVTYAEQPMNVAPPTPPSGGFGTGTGVFVTITLNFPALADKSYAAVVAPGAGYGGGSGSTGVSGAYPDWIGTFPSLTGPNTAPTANPDGDEDNNLLEYFFNTNPALPSPEEKVSVLVFANHTAVVYRKSKFLHNITETVEWSTDLQTWSSDGVTYSADIDQGDHIVRTASVPIMDADTKLFLRIRVTETLPPAP